MAVCEGPEDWYPRIRSRTLRLDQGNREAQFLGRRSYCRRNRLHQTLDEEDLQLMKHFLRLRIQPLQARANPMWNYSGPGDEMKISADLSIDELEKLARRFTKLTKNDPNPSECLVKPYSADHPLPKVIYLSCVEFLFFYFSLALANMFV